MAIRKSNKLLLVVFISYFFFFLGSFRIVNRSYPQDNNNTPKISGSDLPNKVYLFQAPQDTLMLGDILLEQYYIYYLYVEIVTPYNCSLKITLWDPQGKQFDIFESSLHVEPEGANYYEIPFGTALAGNYDIVFYAIMPENVNLYIRMEKGPKCMYDKIPMEEVKDIRLYHVTRFSNEYRINHTILFNTDYMYKFYIGRLSPISMMENNEVRLDLSIKDPDGIIYNIFWNTTLAEINDIDRFKFGTAIEGLYSFTVKIYSNVEYVNIGYSIIALYKIGSGTSTNQTDSTNSTTMSNRYFTMSSEWTIGIVGFAGSISAIIGVVIYKQKKKNVIGSEL